MYCYRRGITQILFDNNIFITYNKQTDYYTINYLYLQYTVRQYINTKYIEYKNHYKKKLLTIISSI